MDRDRCELPEPSPSGRLGGSRRQSRDELRRRSHPSPRPLAWHAAQCRDHVLASPIQDGFSSSFVGGGPSPWDRPRWLMSVVDTRAPRVQDVGSSWMLLVRVFTLLRRRRRRRLQRRRKAHPRGSEFRFCGTRPLPRRTDAGCLTEMKQITRKRWSRRLCSGKRYSPSFPTRYGWWRLQGDPAPLQRPGQRPGARRCVPDKAFRGT